MTALDDLAEQHQRASAAGGKIVVLGDSHILCMLRALRARLPGPHPPGSHALGNADMHFEYAFNGTLLFDMVLQLADGREILNPILGKILAGQGMLNRHRLDDPLAFDGRLCVLYGSLLTPRFGKMTELDRLTFDCDPSDGEMPVSPRLLTDLILELCSKLERALGIMRAYWPECRLYLIGGPPPMFDNSSMVKRQALAGTASPHQRLIVYQRNMDALRIIAERTGAHFVTPPRQIADRDGFLKPRFEGDGIHGNTQYGARMLERLIGLE